MKNNPRAWISYSSFLVHNRSKRAQSHLQCVAIIIEVLVHENDVQWNEKKEEENKKKEENFLLDEILSNLPLVWSLENF